MERKAKSIWIPIYEIELVVLLGGTPEELRDYFVFMDGWAPDFHLITTAGISHQAIDKERKDVRYYVWMENWDWNISDYGNLTHELVHTVSKMLDDCGIEDSPGNDESTAYLTEFVMEACLDAINELLPPFKGKPNESHP
jgi:hypothetical protein